MSIQASPTLPITSVLAKAYRIPTDEPETDGTLGWSSTGMVVVQIKAGGHEGLGYSYTDPLMARFVIETLKPRLLGADAWSVEALFDRLQAQVRNLGRTGLAAMALSAVDIALWDLKARAIGVPLATLLGKVRDGVPVYGSGGFTSFDTPELIEQLEGWTQRDGCCRIKIKIGNQHARDLERVREARRAVGVAELMIDANGAHTVRTAITFAHAVADEGVGWFEEPVTSDDIAGLSQVRQAMSAAGLPIDIAAGEYIWCPEDAMRMLQAEAVDVLQIDATRCGGVTGWRRIAALTQAAHRVCSAHCAPALHLHLGCTTTGLEHIEWFADHARIESMFFDGAPVIQQGEIRVRTDRPGLGLELKHRDVECCAVWEG
ncbi:MULTISPECIES: enolase C-terminal domain-like protein [Pseudomonas]|uniref:enolase C-terminal domain-like protein n=1 Tax=Pseudomonas TaxID=286 RepID=UPI0007322DA3|nr:enolase C-terminal domain-like protein [Pseudomonas fluorescens]